MAGSIGAHETLCLLLNISCTLPVVWHLMSYGRENGDLSCKVFKGNANSDTHRQAHTFLAIFVNTHFLQLVKPQPRRFFQVEYFSPEEK